MQQLPICRWVKYMLNYMTIPEFYVGIVDEDRAFLNLKGRYRAFDTSRS